MNKSTINSRVELAKIMYNIKGSILVFSPNNKNKDQIVATISTLYESHQIFDASKINDEYFNSAFDSCEPDIECLIIDNCHADFDYELFYPSFTRGIIIRNQSQYPFRIRPKLIFISTTTPKLEGASFDRRFDIIKF